MSKGEASKNWRKRCKNKIVVAMGGKCSICGYDKCLSALALHHLNPSEKDPAFSMIMTNHKTWDFVVQELRKCILVCHNCHCEVHAGIINIPNDVIKFNESYALILESNEVMTPCLICDKLKPEHLKFCSKVCSAKSQFKINWAVVDLVEELKTKSIIKLAKELGCSDAAIHKRLKRMGIK